MRDACPKCHAVNLNVRLAYPEKGRVVEEYCLLCGWSFPLATQEGGGAVVVHDPDHPFPHIPGKWLDLPLKARPKGLAYARKKTPREVEQCVKAAKGRWVGINAEERREMMRRVSMARRNR